MHPEIESVSTLGSILSGVFIRDIGHHSFAHCIKLRHCRISGGLSRVSLSTADHDAAGTCAPSIASKSDRPRLIAISTSHYVSKAKYSVPDFGLRQLRSTSACRSLHTQYALWPRSFPQERQSTLNGSRYEEVAGMSTAEIISGYVVTQHESRRQTTGTAEH